MMNCQEFIAQLDEYMDGEMAPGVIDAASAHLHSCSNCQRRLARRHELRASLRSLAVPSPRPEFFEHAVSHARRPEPSRFPAGSRLIGAALAASLVLWFGFGWLPGVVSPPQTGELPGIVIALHETRTVQLAFNSEQALAGATLHIRLPDGVQMRGFPGQREIRWRTDLARGVNLLSLPLTAMAASEGVLLARLEYDAQSTELIIPLRVLESAAKGARAEHHEFFEEPSHA